jgi:ribosomal protein S18 acetylase RimI-like enzyme
VLDYKLDYPEPGDATVNLLLIHSGCQRLGWGTWVVRHLEERLRGRCRRVLAAVYGRNPAACGFWERQGYRFAIDAKPVLDWYAKELPAP